MTAEVKILLVIPVFNHGKTLKGVVEEALRVWKDVLVVDDGSTDGGVKVLEGLLVLQMAQGKYYYL